MYLGRPFNWTGVLENGAELVSLYSNPAYGYMFSEFFANKTWAQFGAAFKTLGEVLPSLSGFPIGLLGSVYVTNNVYCNKTLIFLSHHKLFRKRCILP